MFNLPPKPVSNPLHSPNASPARPRTPCKNFRAPGRDPNVSSEPFKRVVTGASDSLGGSQMLGKEPPRPANPANSASLTAHPNSSRAPGTDPPSHSEDSLSILFNCAAFGSFQTIPPPTPIARPPSTPQTTNPPRGTCSTPWTSPPNSHRGNQRTPKQSASAIRKIYQWIL